MTYDNSGFHRQVAAEMDRSERNGETTDRDDERGLDAILSLAFQYLADGLTVKAAGQIIKARAYLQRNSKNPMQVAVERFMDICDQEVRKYPGLPAEDVRILRIRLMVEELMGSTHPDDPNVTGFTLIKNKSDELVQSILDGNLVGIADGLGDLLYVVFGTAAAFGIDIQEIFDEVHRSNMSKPVWDPTTETWYIKKDEFGKGIKGPNYSPADLEPIVQEQIARGEAFELAMAEFIAQDDEVIQVGGDQA